jgi:hypothetical protein
MVFVDQFDGFLDWDADKNFLQKVFSRSGFLSRNFKFLKQNNLYQPKAE